MTEKRDEAMTTPPDEALDEGVIHETLNDADHGQAAASLLRDDVKREVEEARTVGDDVEWAPIPVGEPAKTEHTPLDPEAGWEALAKRLTSGNVPMNMQRVRAAYEYAAKMHETQKRRDGSPYVTHCIATAEIIAEQGLDEDSVVAALLHDVIEDTPATHDDVKRLFGSSVADIVEGVTKLTRVQ